MPWTNLVRRIMGTLMLGAAICFSMMFIAPLGSPHSDTASKVMPTFAECLGMVLLLMWALALVRQGWQLSQQGTRSTERSWQALFFFFFAIAFMRNEFYFNSMARLVPQSTDFLSVAKWYVFSLPQLLFILDILLPPWNLELVEATPAEPIMN